jgi:hypothetical protein
MIKSKAQRFVTLGGLFLDIPSVIKNAYHAPLVGQKGSASFLNLMHTLEE